MRHLRSFFAPRFATGVLAAGFFTIGFLAIEICTTNLARAAPPPAGKDTVCRASTAEAATAALPTLDDVPRVTAYPSTPIAPAGADYNVTLGRAFDAAKDQAAAAFYLLLMDAEGRPTLVDRAAISARELAETSWQRKAKTVGQGATELVVNLPTLKGWFFHTAKFTIIGCSEQKAPLFVSSFQSQVSDATTFYVLCVIVVALVYWAVGKWCKTVDDPIKRAGHKIRWAAYLDPVVLSSGPNGKGSISRLQVLVFSVIVFYITLNAFLRLGSLPEMSMTVLLLLGISAFGAAAAKVTDNTKNRLDWKSWTWLVHIGWLPKNGLAAITKAKWADLIAADDGMDVYHFQMLVFSLVVIVALLMTGLYGLATFNVPESLLALLGLSQAVYVGGKIVAQPSCSDLDTGIKELLDLQTKYRAVTPKPVDEAAAHAIPQYVALQEQFSKVVTMFESVIGERFSNPDRSAFELEARLA